MKHQIQINKEKDELIQLAKDKGFQAKGVYNNRFLYAPDKEHYRWIFWLTELHLWLLDNTEMIGMSKQIIFNDDIIMFMTVDLNELPHKY